MEKHIIKIDAVLEYTDGEVFINKLNTNEINVFLSTKLIRVISDTIIEQYKGKK